MSITDIILIAMLILQYILFYRERRDFLNRLMSKDYNEYSNGKNPPPKQSPSAHDRVLKKWRNKVGEE